MSRVAPAPPTPSRRRLVLLVLAGVVVALLVGLLVRQLGTPSAGPTTGPSTDGSPTAAAPSSTDGSPDASPSASSEPSTDEASDEPTDDPTDDPEGEGDPEPAPQPTGTVSTKPPKPIKSPDTITRGLTAEVTELQAVDGEASGPGEIAGPAVRVTVTLRNETGKKVDLNSTVVNAYYGRDEAPASYLSGPDFAPLPTSVADGKTATGSYVFAVPEDQREVFLVTVDYSVRTPVVAFRGEAPR